MKKPVFLLTYILFIAQALAQNSNGKVVSQLNSQALSTVNIIKTDNSYKAVTDAFGNFNIQESGTYSFSKENYISKTIYIDESLFTLVELIPITESLNEIIITSNNFQKQLKNLPLAVSVLEASTISQNNSINIAPILNSVSGVYMHNGTLTTNRITIRGIGSRNLFGTSKIRAYYEDIPLTNGSGFSTIEDIDMNTLGRIEILKGPSSSLYGAGLGGTIQLIPNKGLFDNNNINSSYTFGSYGLQKYSLQANIGNLKNSANVTYSKLQSDGYRENNNTKRQTFTIASKHFLSQSDKLVFLGNYIDLKAFIPSSINSDDYINNPSTAAFTWNRAKGFEDYKKWLFGLSWEHQYNSNTKQKTSMFFSFLDSYEPRPFNILQESTSSYGVRTRIISNVELFQKPLNWTIGAEIFTDSNSYETFENLYNDFPPEEGSVQGNLISDFKENRTYYNVFFDSSYKHSTKTNISFGINFNSTSYKLEDSFLIDETDYSGNYKFNTIVSPKLGLTHNLSTKVILYASISHGFSPPSLEETLLPDGLINTNIRPESGWNFEIGSRGNAFNKSLHFDFAIYKMSVKDLLVAQRTDDNQFIGINAGQTVYNGLELGLNHNVINNKGFKIFATHAITYNDFKFKEFIDDNEDYSGNDLTGVPKFTYNSSLNINSNIGFYGIVNLNAVSEIPLRDDNSIYSENYQLFNTKIGFKSKESRKFQFDLFIGINNVFNEKYASMLLINAGSFGGNAPRYFYPGESKNYYAGLKLSYDLK